MIALSTAVVLVLAGLLGIAATAGMGREANNLAHVADAEHEQRHTSWGSLVLLALLGLLLLGVTGAGPLAGVLVLAQ